MHWIEVLAKILSKELVYSEGFSDTSPPMTALMLIAHNGWNSLAKKLVLEGVNVNCQNPYDHTHTHSTSESFHCT
jgi:hypothetical protein